MSAGQFLLSQNSCFKVGTVSPNLAQQQCLLPMLKEPKQLCSEKRSSWGCFPVLRVRYIPQGVWLPAGIRPLVRAETLQWWREPAGVAGVSSVLVTKINIQCAIYSWLQTTLTVGNRPVFFVPSQSRCGLQVIWWAGKLLGDMPANMKGIKILFQQLQLVWVLCDETSRERKWVVRSFTEEKRK